MPTMTRAAPAKARTKTQIMGDISDKTGLTRKEVASVFESMAGLIKKDLRRGPGTFTVPGLMKIKKVHKPAKKAHCHVCGSSCVTHKVFETGQYRCEECEWALQRG